MKKKPLVLVISGPSGVGKSLLCRQLYEHMGFIPSISVTTREIRGKEKDGVDYHFISAKDFADRMECKQFIEYAEVHGCMYGTLLDPVLLAINGGSRLLLDIDVKGHASVKAYPNKQLSENVKSVFLMPPSMEELERRLRGRADTLEEKIQERLANAPVEIRRAGEYDHIVIAHNPQSTFDQVVEIVEKYTL